MGTAFARIREAFTGERYAEVRKQAWRLTVALVRRPMASAGIGLILAFIVMAVFAPWIAGPFPRYFPPANVGTPNLPPGPTAAEQAATGDTYLSTEFPGDPHGTESVLWIRRDGFQVERTLLRFRLGLIPSDVLVSAELHLTVADASGFEWPANASVARFVGNWSETASTWQTNPVLPPRAAESFLVSGPPARGITLTFDVRNQIEHWRAEGARTPFDLVLSMALDVESAGLAFASRESQTLPRPELVVTYDPQFPLGTDFAGRSNFAILIYGARVSLIIGGVSSIVATIIGALVGVAAGYYGRFPDKSLSMLTNFFLVIPWLPFVLVVASVVREIDIPGIRDEDKPFWTTLISISLVSWPTTARVVRSKVLSVKTLTYVQRARAIGAGDRHIMLRHILPVLLPLVFANTILTVSSAIWTESFLAFFGLSDPNQPSWGAMIEKSWRNLDFVRGAFWAFLPPGICITALVLAFTMVSRVLEDMLNPRLRKR